MCKFIVSVTYTQSCPGGIKREAIVQQLLQLNKIVGLFE